MGLSAVLRATVALSSLHLGGCAPIPARYQEPTLPADQLALVTVDSRATVLEIDGAPLLVPDGEFLVPRFYVKSGCRQLLARYEQSYFIWGEKRAGTTALDRSLVPVISLGNTIANSEIHDYETTVPIRFFVPSRPGHKYWVTASFTGDQFLPRVVELDASGEAVARFLPDQPCGK